MQLRRDTENVMQEALDICKAAGYPKLAHYAAGKVRWRLTGGVGEKYVAYAEWQSQEALTVLEAMHLTGEVYAGQQGFYNRAFMARASLNEMLSMMDGVGGHLANYVRSDRGGRSR